MFGSKVADIIYIKIKKNTLAQNATAHFGQLEVFIIK